MEMKFQGKDSEGLNWFHYGFSMVYVLTDICIQGVVNALFVRTLVCCIFCIGL